MSMLTLIFPVGLLLLLLLLLFIFMRVALGRDPLAEGAEIDNRPAGMGWYKKRYPMDRRDILPLIAIVVVYAVVAFWGLGKNTAPQSFCRFVERGRYVLIELEETTEISQVMYYSGLYSGEYRLQFSEDGETWREQSSMEQSHADLFKWQYATLMDTQLPVKFVRITADKLLELGELALYDGDGNLIPSSVLIYDEGCATLFDEQEMIPPEGPTYLNSAYFDEIYHARTAYENVTNVYPYEVSHPPLGKLIISIGIHLFGMTPIGWRFMGTLFGVLMLPFLYIFLKNMFGKRSISICGTLIFAFDFMHFVQTRIATIDTYAVFFVLGMYFFMYRYLTVDRDDPLVPDRRWMLPLFMSGLFFGLGAASKWTVIYGGAGLALAWAMHWFFRGRDLIRCGRKRQFFGEFAGDVGLSLLAFIVVPAAVYYMSYYPYGKASGLNGASMFLSSEYFGIVMENQSFMFRYHVGVDSTHPYSSSWYQWIVNGRPILYYLQYVSEGTKSAFGAFLNPFVCWGGLMAMLGTATLAFRRKDGRALFILIGYLSQLLPWVLVPRLTFEYHYFPCVVFLVLAICYAFDVIESRSPWWRRQIYGLTALSVALFVMFYPVLTGVETPTWYTTYFLKWIPEAWPF